MSPRSNQRRLRGLGLLLLLFVAGAVLGWSLASSNGQGGPSFSADTLEVSVDGDPFESLGLTTQQRAVVDSIIDALGARTDSLLAESREALVDEARQARVGIRDVLTDEQAVAFDSVLEELGGLKVRVAKRLLVPDSGPPK